MRASTRVAIAISLILHRPPPPSSIVSSRRSGRRAEPGLASAAGEGERSDKRDTAIQARRRHATDASAKAHDSVAIEDAGVPLVD